MIHSLESSTPALHKASSQEKSEFNTTGIAGAVFQSGIGEIVHNPYDDDRFNAKIDEQTGFVTKNIICAPVKTVRGEVIGVIQILNKKGALYKRRPRHIRRGYSTSCHLTPNAQGMEEMEKSREKEMQFLDIVSDVTAEIELGSLLQRVMLEPLICSMQIGQHCF